VVVFYNVIIQLIAHVEIIGKEGSGSTIKISHAQQNARTQEQQKKFKGD
jgi:hypothetical protein